MPVTFNTGTNPLAELEGTGSPYSPSNIFSTKYGLTGIGGAPSQPSAGLLPGATGYNVNPQPQGTSYSSTFGGVPGSVTVPNPFQDLSSVYPNLSGTNQAASSALLSELTGQLSPETQALLQDRGAAFGVSSGMPGSGLARSRTLRDLGLTSEQLQQQGIADYSHLIPSVSLTQTVNPNLQAEIAARNAQMLAAPIPAQAASYAKSLFDQYLNQLRGPQGGGRSPFSPAGGTGTTGGLGFGFGTLGPTPGPPYINPAAVATTSSTDPANLNFDPGNPNVTDEQLMNWITGTSVPQGSDLSAPVDNTDISALYPSPFDEGGGF